MDYTERARVFLFGVTPLRFLDDSDRRDLANLAAEFVAIERETRRKTLEEARDAMCDELCATGDVPYCNGNGDIDEACPVRFVVKQLAAMDAEDAKEAE